MSQEPGDDIRKMLELFNADQMTGMDRLARAMGAPLKAKLDYAGLARRMFQTDSEVGQSIWRPKMKTDVLGDGDIPIYDKD